MTQTSRRWKPVAAIAAGVLLLVAGIFALWIYSLGPVPLGTRLEFSTAVVDRDGRLLRPYATPEGRWRLPAQADGVDPRYLSLLIAYEDKRFRSHAGVDPAALLRAAGQMLASGHIVSGGSTLTMQVARLLEPRSERSLAAKLRQIVRAVELERALTKDEVLALYLSLAPYGGNLEGIRAASLAYFGKEPRRLTLGESALLVALPQSPEARRPDRSAEAARRARDRVLDRIASSGLFADTEIVQAKAEPVPAGRTPMPMLAAHAADEAVAAAPRRSLIRLTIDGTWQASLEALARERARALGPDVSVAILAVDHASGEVLARVGSAGYFEDRRAGQVDMTNAVRSPGSTLKPFIYGLGFEDGVVHPETLIEDRPVRYGSYAPENFDLSFQGTVAVRRALQMSLNVPAVAVLDKIGAGRFTARLRQAGGDLVLPKGEVPGLAMGLGGVGVRLSDLVRLYAGLARLGTTVPLTERMPAALAGGRRAAARCGAGDGTADGAGGGLVCRQHLAWHAAAGECSGRPHRLQDRHQLWISRRLVGRLRRQAHHRRLGRPARWRAGAGSHRPRRGGTDPVRCICAFGQDDLAAAPRAARRIDRGECQAAVAAAALPPGRPAERGQRAGAQDHVPAERRAARADRRSRISRPVGGEDFRWRAAAHRARQRRSARERHRKAHVVLSAGRSGLRAADRDGRQGRNRQHRRAIAVERADEGRCGGQGAQSLPTPGGIS